MKSSGTITPIDLPLSEITEALTCLVQIELQQNGSLWQLKGCTAYFSNGTKRPIPFPAEGFHSRADAIQVIKRQACQDVTARHREMYIKWQEVMWDPNWHVGSDEHVVKMRRSVTQL